MATKPTVSIIMLNWNGKKWLLKSLPSLRKLTYKPLELILVNNGSKDDSYDYVKKNYPEVKIIELKKNIGFAGANNVGVKAAKGKYVVLLNNDTQVTPNFLQPLVNDMENDNTLGAVQPQMRSMIKKDLLDSVGSFYTSTGFLYHFGYMKPHKNKLYGEKLYAYSIKGACVMMKKDEYISLGGLDEDFVCYVEETDLCHRLWLSGKKVLYEPESVMYHWGGGDMQIMTKNELTTFRSFRNRIVSYLKNFSVLELVKLLPVHILFCFFYIGVSIVSGKFKQAGAAFLGIIVPIVMLPSILKKRTYIQQKIRKVKDAEIMHFIKREPRILYYYHFFKNPESYKD